MNGKELLKKLQEPSSKTLFEKLYGQDGADAGKKRYISLIENLLSEKEFPRADFPEADGELRLFTSAGRTELGGNHTDHNRGRVLAASIQLDIAAVVAARTDNKIFLRSAGYPDALVYIGDLAAGDGSPDLKPKEQEKGTTQALIRGIAAEFINRGAQVKGFTVTMDSTVLLGSGLSSSAAVEVLFGRIINNLYHGGKCSALEIAQIGQKAENVYFGKPCGLMDQTACAAGGAVAIDFADPAKPLVKQVDVDFTTLAYALCVVNTGGSHENLTPDYAAIPGEMKAVAAFFGKEVLRECDKAAVEKNAPEIREKFGDRALLRAFHFFDENQRALDMHILLEKLSTTSQDSVKQEIMSDYLNLVNESGNSSWELLQNVYSTQNVKEQGISVAIAMTRSFLLSINSNGAYNGKLLGACNGKLLGACRVHGGGFAGTIQAYIPITTLEQYRSIMDKLFGPGSLTVLRIRPVGAEELLF